MLQFCPLQQSIEAPKKTSFVLWLDRKVSITCCTQIKRGCMFKWILRRNLNSEFSWLINKSLNMAFHHATFKKKALNIIWKASNMRLSIRCFYLKYFHYVLVATLRPKPQQKQNIFSFIRGPCPFSHLYSHSKNRFYSPLTWICGRWALSFPQWHSENPAASSVECTQISLYIIRKESLGEFEMSEE